jgi:CheY-like chemotaxis protein
VNKKRKLGRVLPRRSAVDTERTKTGRARVVVHGSNEECLAVCRSVVTALGGEITVERAADRVATFRITLPRPRPTNRSGAPARSVARRGRILVVDDEEMIVSAVHEALRDHEVVVETEGQSALRRLLDGARFDLILCDLMMPELSGMDLYTRIKEQIPEQAERFVFMTGGAFTPRSRSFLASVPNLRLEKPFDLQHLLSLVRDHLRRTRTTEEITPGIE